MSDDYFAGLLDGEGTFYIKKEKGRGRYPFSFTARVTAEMNDLPPIQALQSAFGGTLNHIRRLPERNDTHVWGVSGQNLLDRLNGKLLVKQAQLSLLQEFLANVRVGASISKEAYEVQTQCYLRMRTLNLRGVHDEESISGLRNTWLRPTA